MRPGASYRILNIGAPFTLTTEPAASLRGWMENPFVSPRRGLMPPQLRSEMEFIISRPIITFMSP